MVFIVNGLLNLSVVAAKYGDDEMIGQNHQLHHE